MHHPPTPRTAARAALGALAAGCAAGLVLVAAPGWAHVEVSPGTAEQGGYAELSFQVPSESDKATTTRIQVFLPQDHPLASVSVKPHPGWHAKVVTRKLPEPMTTDDGQVTEGVYSITWTPDTRADALQPGQYDDFDISAGPLPDVPSLEFKTLQTYSDGTVVRWIDPPAPEGDPEPEHPAPTLTLVPASDVTGDASAAPAADAGSDGTATTALVLAIVAVLLGLGALGRSFLGRSFLGRRRT
jgi:uncharacterized protein YcnI